MTSMTSRTTLFFRRLIALFAVLVFATTMLRPNPTLALPAGPPEIWLPTPVGETWNVIQGYFCGTHWEGHEIDFARLHGSTVGAPVRAAADGVVHFWTPSSGTLIVSHGNHYYTEYTHMSQAYVTRPGSRIVQGQEIGRINGYAHLHFSLYYSPSGSYFSRRTVPLNFADGYSFPELSGCNQHYGRRFVARDNPDPNPPGVQFTSAAQANRWYREDQRIEFKVSDDRQVRGFSQAFDDEPGGEAPDFQTDTGYMQLSWGGEGYHTIRVRAWDVYGHQTLASFGPIGYDAADPTFPLPDTVPERVYTPDAGQSVYLSWEPASDGNGSGVAGYFYYLGDDPNGTSDTFNDYHGAGFAGLLPGCYVLRVQAVDRAERRSEWITMQQVIITDESGEKPSCAPPSDTRTPLPATETTTSIPLPATETTTSTPQSPVDEPFIVVAVGAGATVLSPTTTALSPTAEPTATPTPATAEPTATPERQVVPVRLVPVQLTPVSLPGDQPAESTPSLTPTPVTEPTGRAVTHRRSHRPPPRPVTEPPAEPVHLITVELTPVSQPAPPAGTDQEEEAAPSAVAEPAGVIMPTMLPEVPLVPVVPAIVGQ
ncbi:MAG: M23 family metallopeptidase [Chloroflexaceae bacterium]|nr:M23 family metallopeptidase [Chloroflexaceae bacterium]